MRSVITDEDHLPDLPCENCEYCKQEDIWNEYECNSKNCLYPWTYEIVSWCKSKFKEQQINGVG